ncbi:hypothetical protein A5N15_07200 [Rothia kristinae]|uniref:Uncharacterized protein n=1 Tax=Rothia kristinae TaxID=37923 RepID=A0A657IU69_9MICC|nr:hypothetical protein A5N15_07200 [Rothia kristinae]
MLLIRGTTRRTGPRGISVTAHQAWDLRQLMDGTAPLPFAPARTAPWPPAEPADGSGPGTHCP